MLKRRAPNETVERFRVRNARAVGEAIADGSASTVEPLLEELRDAEPELPKELDDRAQDVWEPLLAIAAAAGGEWLEKARAAAKRLSGNTDPEDDSLGIRLLADIRDVFDEEDQLATQELRRRLSELEEAPCGAWNDGEGIRARELANKLRPYGIKSRDLWTSGASRKGYRKVDFEDAWSRFLPVSPDSKREVRENGCSKPETAPCPSAIEGSHRTYETGHKPHGNADLANLADGDGGYGDADPLFGDIDPDPMAPPPRDDRRG